MQVSKLQREIDEESENKKDLVKVEEESIDQSQKAFLRQQIDKSEEKVEALMMMMLHYCAGLQYCMDQEQEEKQKGSSTNKAADETESQGVLKSKESLTVAAEDSVTCPAISVEVASSPEETTEDFALFPEKEDDSVHMEDTSNLSQDSMEDSDQLQEEDMFKSAIMDEKDGLSFTDRDDLLSLKQSDAGIDEEDILTDVINTVTEIIEKSEGETDSSDFEDTIKHSTH